MACTSGFSPTQGDNRPLIIRAGVCLLGRSVDQYPGNRIGCTVWREVSRDPTITRHPFRSHPNDALTPYRHTMKPLTIALLAAGLAAVTIGSIEARDSQDAAQAIRDNEAQWNRDFAAKDVDKLLAHYADDAVLMSPGTPTATGRDAIRAELKEMISDSALSLSFQASRVEVSKSGDMAYSQGTYEMTMTNPQTKKPVNDKGTYVTVYRKAADGSWKAVSDIASSGTMPAIQ